MLRHFSTAGDIPQSESNRPGRRYGIQTGKARQSVDHDSKTRLRPELERLHRRFNRPEWIDPDPLAVLGDYSDPPDRELAGLVAASLAFGGVRQIMASARTALAPYPSPHAGLLAAQPREIRRTAAGFRHRYVSGVELAALLLGARRVLLEHGSLGGLFTGLARPEERDFVPALTRFAGVLRAASGLEKNYLLPDPAGGSACKRWFLYLRWMVRRDAVDPGLWQEAPASKLIVPMDLHMHRICLRLGFTARRAADLRAALEATAGFRSVCPEDPVRYDFCLTRAAMHDPAALAPLFGAER